MTQSWAGYVERTSTAGAGDDWDIEDQTHLRLIAGLDERVLRGLPLERAHEVVQADARMLLAQLYPSLPGDRRERIIDRVVDEILGLGPIEPLLRDPRVSEVMVNGPRDVYFERDGLIQRSDAEFRDDAHVFRMIDRIVSAVGRHVDEASPMVDARLRDGSRVNVVIPPLVPRGPVVTIRRFLGGRFTRLEDLARIGSLSEDMVRLLEACVRTKLSVVVSGGTGSGKTTLLNAMSAAIPEGERIVTIEDPIELKLQQRHTVAMEARPPSIEGAGEVTQRALLRNALRMRPDRIIIGEVRGAEAFDMLQAMNTGHEGSLTTVHANSARDALSRIENMVLMSGFELPLSTIRDQMASAFHLIVQISRMSDGSRKVVGISEVTGTEGTTVTMQELFVYKQTGIDSQGQVEGAHQPTGVRPVFTDRLHAFGIDLGPDIFGASRWA